MTGNEPAANNTLFAQQAASVKEQITTTGQQSRGAEYASVVFEELMKDFSVNDVIDFKVAFTAILNQTAKRLVS